VNLNPNRVIQHPSPIISVEAAKRVDHCTVCPEPFLGPHQGRSARIRYNPCAHGEGAQAKRRSCSLYPSDFGEFLITTAADCAKSSKQNLWRNGSNGCGPRNLLCRLLWPSIPDRPTPAFSLLLLYLPSSLDTSMVNRSFFVPPSDFVLIAASRQRSLLCHRHDSHNHAQFFLIFRSRDSFPFSICIYHFINANTLSHGVFLSLHAPSHYRTVPIQLM